MNQSHLEQLLARRPSAHIAVAVAIEQVCREHGLVCPVICTPEDLMGT